MDRERKEKEAQELAYQKKLRAVDMILVRFNNNRNLVSSYLEDSREEIEARDVQGVKGILVGLPVTYWKGREALCIELLARLDKNIQDVQDLLKFILTDK